LTELKFSEFSLAPEVFRGITDAGFTYCTPIQSKTLPIALAGRDVAGQAQTGTGKTAAYLIALYQYLLTHEPLDDRQPGPRALILAPTRELAVQIHSDATLLGAHLPYKLGLAFGGTDYEKQKRQLSEGVDVLIGTPGRLIDFFKQGIFGLRRVQVAVLDEADRMFDLGFLRDIRYILRRLPPAEQRLNLLFSATLSYRVLELAYEHMNDPELVRIEPDKLTVDRVRQVIYFPSNEEKLPLLVTLLREMDAKRTMVFVNTRRGAEHLRDALEHNGIQAAALSGDVPQRKRLKLLRDFQAGELPVLIATDVASRGLHVPDVSHVFNYDLPQDPEDYVHRVGRTARAGASGDAISFGCEDYVVSLPEIEEYIGRKIDVGTYDHEKLEKVSVPPRPRRSERRDARGGGRDARGGRRGPPGRHRDRDDRRPETDETSETGSVRADAQPGRNSAEGGERERGDAGERRRSRRRGRRSTGSGADAGDRAERERRPADEYRAAGISEGDAAIPGGTLRGPAEADGTSEHGADNESGAPPKRRRRRRGRRNRSGAPEAREGAAASAPAETGEERADRQQSRDEPPRSRRPRRGGGTRRDHDARADAGARPSRDTAGSRGRSDAAAGDDTGRRDRVPTARHERADSSSPSSPPRPADAPRGDGPAERGPGLLARIWSAFKR